MILRQMPEQRSSKGQFLPGNTGNPGGVPNGSADVRALARTLTTEAIHRLAYWMRSDDARASVPACNALLDRGWGKPAQAVEVTGRNGEPLQAAPSTDLSKLTGSEFKTFRKLLLKAKVEAPLLESSDGEIEEQKGE